MGLQIPPSDQNIQLSDITTANATIARHGFLKKLSNVASEFLDGTGNYSTPAGAVQTALTYAATTDVDFNLSASRTLALTGNVTFTTSNKAASKSVSIKILADGSIRTFTFPAWKFLGAAAPTGIAASKTAILSLTCFGAADTDIVAAYAVEL